MEVQAAPTGCPWFEHYDPEVPRALDYPRGTVVDLFEENVRKNPGKDCLIFFGARLTYGETSQLVDQLALALSRMGLGQGDRIALLMANCPQYVISYYAILKLGATVVPVNPLSAERELEYIFSDGEVKALIALDLLAGKVETVRERLRGGTAAGAPREIGAPGAAGAPGAPGGAGFVPLEHVVYTSLKDFMPFPLKALYPLKQKLSPAAKAAVPKGTSFMSLLGGPPGALPKPVIDTKNDLACLIYTGGTTGKPKGVMLSNFAVVVNAYQATRWGGIYENDQVIAVLPLFHGFGMSLCMNIALIAGGGLLLVPRFDAGECMKLVQRYRPTVLCGVPTMIVAMINHPDIKTRDLSSLRGAFIGAAALPSEVKKRFEELTGGEIIEGYGLTEAVTCKSGNPYRGRKKIGSIGLPFPDTIFEVVDIETGERVLSAGEVGELRLKSPDLMLGYWNKPEETAQALRGGWLYTGDLATMDEQGYFYIVDRKKDMIITGGFNVYPTEVEEVLYLHPAVQEACVVGIPDDYRGETVKAFVKLRQGATRVTADDIIAFCKRHLTPYKVPRLVEFVDDFPKSAIGKILRRELRETEKASGANAGRDPAGSRPGAGC